MGLENFRNRFIRRKEEESREGSSPRLHNSQDNYLGRKSADSFQYYSHPVDQTAPRVWNEMLSGMKGGYKRIVGFLKEDDIVCWSDQANWHSTLTKTALTEEEVKDDKIKAFLAIYGMYDGLDISVFSHLSNDSDINTLADYVDRNVTDQREKITLVVYGTVKNIYHGPISDYAKRKKR
jgi:hypothetical protein